LHFWSLASGGLWNEPSWAAIVWPPGISSTLWNTTVSPARIVTDAGSIRLWPTVTVTSSAAAGTASVRPRTAAAATRAMPRAGRALRMAGSSCSPDAGARGPAEHTSVANLRPSARSLARRAPAAARAAGARYRTRLDAGARGGSVSDLAGRVAIVTGGGSGLGRAGALALARAGARVLVGDVDAPAARATATAIEAAGGAARACRADAGCADDAARMVREAVDAFGALHVLYNNAGVAWPGRDGFTADVDPKVWDEVIRINLSRVFYCAHAAIPAIAAAGGGSIVNTASSMARLPLGALDGYAASKGGVALLTQSMAAGCGRLGIRVNAICPGY